MELFKDDSMHKRIGGIMHKGPHNVCSYMQTKFDIHKTSDFQGVNQFFDGTESWYDVCLIVRQSLPKPKIILR